jgi:hypothetical protein
VNVTARGLAAFLVFGLVLGFATAFTGLFRENRTAVYVVVGVAVFLSVFVVRFRQELKKRQPAAKP